MVGCVENPVHGRQDEEAKDAAFRAHWNDVYSGRAALAVQYGEVESPCLPSQPNDHDVRLVRLDRLPF